MIHAYLDESGIHDGAPICVIAGYFGGKGPWRRFAKEWRTTLARFGMPIHEFHAKDLLKKDGPRYRNLAQSLGEAIKHYSREIHPVTSAIIIPDFESFPLDYRRFMTGATLKNNKLIGTGSPDKPYYVPFQSCLKRVSKHARAGGKAHFFFGLDRTFSSYAEDLYHRAKSDPLCPFRNRLGRIGFPMAKETPQLQAADLLVHLTYQYAQQMMEKDSWGRVQPMGILRDALAGLRDPADHSYQDRDCLVKTLTVGIEEFTRRMQSLAC